jgi:hypothetical protein
VNISTSAVVSDELEAPDHGDPGAYRRPGLADTITLSTAPCAIAG